MPSLSSCARLAVLFVATLLNGTIVQAQAPATPAVDLFVDAPLGAAYNYIRYGSPILFQGRILPSDAAGTVTLFIDGAPVQTVPVGQQPANDYIALGDSITAGTYFPDNSYRYPGILAQHTGRLLRMFAAPGATACQIMPQQLLLFNIGNNSNTDPLYSLMVGTNDLNIYGVGVHETDFNLCHQAALTWIGMARSTKVLPGDQGIVTTAGVWSTTAVPGSYFNLLSSVAAGSAMRFTLTSEGMPAYLWFVLQSSPGTFTIGVDGAAPTTNSTQFTTPEQVTSSYGLLRIPLAAGTHTFDITALNANIGILGMGTPLQGAPLATILAGDVPNQLNYDPPAGIAAYTSDIESNLKLLSSDGLDMRYVPTEKYMGATASEMMDNLHPNALGNTELAAAFEAALSPAHPLSAPIISAAASITRSDVPIGNHSVFLAYSGDQKYAPTTQFPWWGLSVYDGTSTTTLNTDAGTIPANSPASLTATVAQSGAVGMVNFLDQTATSNLLIGTAWLNPSAGPSTATLTTASLAPGPHRITAQYLGSAQYATSSSQPLSLQVSSLDTATTLSVPATTFSGRSSIPLTATVSAPSATGTLTFLDGLTILAQIPVTNGQGLWTAANLSAGQHILTASYSGDQSFNASVSPPIPIAVNAATTVAALAPLAASMPYGSTTTLTATISPASATGTISFTDTFTAPGALAGVSTLGQATIQNALATFAAPSFAPGTHTIMATYSGDLYNLPSTATPATTQITPANSTIALGTLASTVTYGTAIALSAAVTPTAATGIVTFTDATTGRLCQAALATGTASCSLPTLPTGFHSISAVYAGDTFRSASTSAAITTIVRAAPSTAVLSALPPTVLAGSSFTLQASVTPASATGTILFRDAILGTLGQATLFNGTASITLPTSSAANFNITAAYSGDSDAAPSTSAPVSTQVILNPTAITLLSSANPIATGAPLNLTAAIVANSTIQSGIQTGSVTFSDGATILGSAIVLAGRASLSIPTLTPGPHTLLATYTGDNLYATSTSAALLQTIVSSATSTSITLAQTSLIAGTPILVNLQLHTTGTVPTGTMTLRSNTTVLALANLAAATIGSAYVALSIPSTALGLGTFPLVATYSGDSADQPSDTSATPVSVIILPIPSTATLTLSNAQIPLSGTTSISVHLASSTTTPTGSVTFLRNDVAIATAALDATGNAILSMPGLFVGSYRIAATFVPTGIFAASASTAQMLVVTPPLTQSVTPAIISATTSLPGVSTLILAPESGFTGPTSTQCQSASSNLTCTLDPLPALTSSTPVRATVRVTLNPNANLALTSPRNSFAAATLLALLVPLVGIRSKSRRKLYAVLLITGLLSGCAEGGTFGFVQTATEYVTLTTTAAGTTFTSYLTVNISK